MFYSDRAGIPELPENSGKLNFVIAKNSPVTFFFIQESCCKTKKAPCKDSDRAEKKIPEFPALSYTYQDKNLSDDVTRANHIHTTCIAEYNDIRFVRPVSFQ